MTPERIAEIRERYRPKPNRDYTDCGECYEEHPCETIQALDALAVAEARAAAAEQERDVWKAATFNGEREIANQKAARHAAEQRADAAVAALERLRAYHGWTVDAYARVYGEPTDDEPSRVIERVLAAGGPAEGRGE